MKVGLGTCKDKEIKEDKENPFIKRCLYLLKKSFVIWPKTSIKYDTIKKGLHSLKDMFKV
jgi:hypothetical protein